ncbi:MAG TPA: DUF418 domain-containing protein [Sphingomicrobium sp.]|nr:DUF418 domain-containing protein [Sphingomicrobium sp.]
MAGQAITAPIGTGERSTILDALRGYALLGILIANMAGFIGYYFIDDAARAALPLAQLSDPTEFLMEWLVVGKFYSIFSLLFGIGFAIQMGRLEQRGEGTPRYLRRLAILFLIGLAHILLLWFGDIGALYALIGAVLLLFRKASDRVLLWGALICWSIPILWSAAIHFGGFQPAEPLFKLAFSMLAAVGVSEQSALPIFRSADFLFHLRTHPADLLFRIGDLVYQMRFTKVLGMFLIGLWVGRRALYANLDQYRPLLRRTALIGLGIGLPLSAGKAALTMLAGDNPQLEFAAEFLYVLSTPTLALGYAAGFALLWRAGRRGLLEWAAPAGRMALTNYLTQTIVQSAIFYGWGLGLIGKFGLVFILPFSLAIFALQVTYSSIWLNHFRFGPVEWLWRSLTYGKWQPMRRTATAAAVAA